MTAQNTRIEAFTPKTKLAADRPQTVDVLLKITPPDVEQNTSKRPRINLSVVLDRSGSMQGSKIREAKDAAVYCIDQLLATDRLSTVVFDDSIDILIPSQKVENKELLKNAISSIRSGGSTALHEAWVRGGLQVSEYLDADAVNRVLLITDGQANVGETDVDVIVSQTRELADKGVSTSTIGIGRDFNEDLLMPMADAGQGNAWHVQEPEDMTKIFETELQGLVARIGHNVRLKIVPARGVRVVDLLNDFETDSDGSYKLPNLQAGSPLEIVVRLSLPSFAVGDKSLLASFELSFTGQELKKTETASVTFNTEFAGADEVAALSENTDVTKAVLLLMNARARREAVERMDRHDFAGAKSALAMAAQATDDMFSLAPSPQLRQELDDLAAIESEIDRDGVMARKMGNYQSYNRRTGKDR